MRLLARRDHSAAELAQKLQQRSFSDEDIETVTAYLLERSWLDDYRFAEGLLRYRSGAGYGPFYIKQAMAAKGVSKDIINEVVDDNDARWLTIATETVHKSIRTMTIDEDWGRLSRKLQRRGFAHPIIIQALKNAREEQESS